MAVLLDGSYVVAPGQLLPFSDGDVSSNCIFSTQLEGVGTSSGSFIDRGDVEIVAPNSDVTGVNILQGGPMQVAAGAVFNLRGGGMGVGFRSITSAFSNDGRVTVSSDTVAEGVATSVGAFHNGGILTVRASSGGSATGIGGVGSGSDGAAGACDNSGAIFVTSPWNAIGIQFGGPAEVWTSTGAVALVGGEASFVNSGSVTAMATEADASFAIAIQSYADLDVTNTGAGIISASSASGIPGSAWAVSSLANLHLVNQGTIDGDIAANASGANTGATESSVILNTGTIIGNIDLGMFGDDVYDGRGGTLSGTLTLGGGHDTVYLGNEGESVRAGAGVSTVYGGSGTDAFIGGAGATTFIVGGGNDVLKGGGGLNVASFASATTGVTVDLGLTGPQNTGFGVDAIAEFQNLTGSPHDDHLTGDANKNVIDGGGGTDVLTGGGGADTFVFHPGYGADEITDFSVTSGDKIDLSAFANLQDFNAVAARTSQSGANAVINLGGGTTITLDGMQASSLRASNFVLPPANDFAQSGSSDVLFRNGATGDWGFMSIDGSGGQTWHPIGASSTAFAVIGTGDFDGSGGAEVAFRNTSTGDWGYMSVSASGQQTWHPLGASSLAFAIVGVGDMAGTGSSDIVFQDTATGDIGYMAVTASGTEQWTPMGQTSLAFTAYGTGDFLGDGQVGELFRNTSTGDIGFMTASPSGGETWHAIGQTSTAFSVIGVGDFDGSGRDEVAFRNPNTGDWGYMSANPGGGETWHALGASSLAFAPVAIGDFDGDGHADVAFRNGTTGDWGYMSVDASGEPVWHAIGASSTAFFVV